MEDLRRAAAEYVLGTLDEAQRTAFRERMAGEPDLAALVRLWETRFAPLYELSASAKPPDGLLSDILAALPREEEEAPAEGEAVLQPSEPDVPPAAEEVAAAAEGGMEVSVEVSPEEAPAGAPADIPTEPDVVPVPAPELPMPAREPEPVEVSVPEIPPVAEVGIPLAGEAAVETVAAAPEPTPEAEPAPPAPAAPPPPAPPSSPPEPVGREGGNPWRVVAGLLALVLLFGGTALAYRELHRPVEKPKAPAPVAEVVPPPPAPSAPQDPVPVKHAFFAVLNPQPMDGVALTLDPDTGEVTVLQLPAVAPEGMQYNLWATSDVVGTRRLAVFREAAALKSEELANIGGAGLAGARLMLTLEPEALEPPTPSGEVVFSGQPVAQ